MPTAPVHNLYEGFDNIGKTLTAFEKTMSEVSDTHWRESAKPGDERMPDDLEDEDWIKANAAQVPDPKPPIEILERGFVALHGTFDAFESFMKKQHESKEGKVLAVPAELSKVIPRTLNTGTEVESESKEKGHIGQNLAKYDVSPNNKLDDRQSNLAVRLADTQKSIRLAAEPSRKHPYNNQDPANGDGLPPLKRRAVSGQERGTAAVGASAFVRPEYETGPSVRSSNDRGTAISERDRSHSMPSQGRRSTNRQSLDQRQEKLPPQAFQRRFISCQR